MISSRISRLSLSFFFLHNFALYFFTSIPSQVLFLSGLKYLKKQNGNKKQVEINGLNVL